MTDLLPLAGGHYDAALVLLLVALAIDMFLGLVPGLAKLLPDRLSILASPARFLDARLNRAGRSEANLLLRGAVVTLLVVALAAAAGFAVAWAGRALPYGWALELVALLLVVTMRHAFADLRRGLRAAGSDDLAAGHALVSRALGRDSSALDRYGVARAVIELGAVRFARRAVVPAFWFLLLGFPGLFVSRAVAHLAVATLGRDISARAYGAAAMRLDHVLGLLPSLLAAWLLGLAAFAVPQGSVQRAFQVMSLDARRDEVVNDGRLKGAAAGGLGLALGGPFGTRGGGGARDAWIGNGRARVGQGDIRRMIYLTAVANLLLLAFAAALTASLLR